MKEIEVTFSASSTPDKNVLLAAVARKAGLKFNQITSSQILKRSLDARGKEVLYRYRVRITSGDEPLLEKYSIPEYQNVADKSTDDTVIIVGAGPAGLFAALSLLQNGKKPIILERGKDVHARKFDMAKLSRQGVVNPNSNYCFGEGGAGTFSDGKLYTRSNKRGDIREVLHQFVKFGADPNIMIESHAHIGSDKLPRIIENIRNCIIAHGGQIHFNTHAIDFEFADGLWNVICTDSEDESTAQTSVAQASAVQASAAQASVVQASAVQASAVQPSVAQASVVQTSAAQASAAQASAVQDSVAQASAVQASAVQASAAQAPAEQASAAQASVVQPSVAQYVVASRKCFTAPDVILATGHSARDVYELFNQKGWPIEAKGFALGVRAEHPQRLINEIQYRGKYHPKLPAAEYSLVCQVDGRGAFSFCMCPGGILVPSATGPGEAVLNGMSNSMRNSKWANAGIVVSVEPEDVPEYQKFGPLQLLRFQQDVEKKMYSFTDSIKAPAQRMDDFVNGRISKSLPETSYVPGAVSAPLHELLPPFVADRLRKAFGEFNKKMKGYYTSSALLLAVESRTSSPVRIPRDPETLQHTTLHGIYPCGEGAGYAGGIVSSALDGINVAKKIAGKL